MPFLQYLINYENNFLFNYNDILFVIMCASNTWYN